MSKIVLSTPIKVVCQNCDEFRTIKPTDFETPFVISQKREKENEKEHRWNTTFTCGGCKKDYDVTVVALEYPEGYFKYSSDCQGCTIEDIENLKDKFKIKA